MTESPPPEAPATPFHSGFVCLVGRPNVGKSTLLNRLVGRDISITTPKPQTTRNRILGARHGDGWQAVLVDTPGIHAARDPLNRRMVRYATLALADADLVLVLVEPGRSAAGGDADAPGPQDRLVFEHVRKAGRPALLAINKVDLAGEAEVLATIRAHDALGLFDEIVPLSARTGANVERLEALIAARLPEGPAYFEPDQVTDQPERTLIAEFIRQAIFHRTRQELPYSTAVQVEHMEDDGHLLRIQARIYVERDSQKGIMLGQGGRMIRAVGTEARERIEGLLGTRVFLGLHVDVLSGWSQDPRRLAELGYPEE